MVKNNIKYEFSLPMPYSIQDINKILDINNNVKNSQIKSLYASLPSNCNLFTGFEQSRNYMFEYNDWAYWQKLIKYTISQGCDFIYLLNSPRPLDITNINFPNQITKLEKLLEELQKIGVKKLRVASAQLSTYIAKHFKEFEILASTALEYKTIWEYQNFIAFHPEVKQIVPSHDVNKNFKLLSILRTRYPNIEIELMLNEGCLQGCPNRMLHESIDVEKRDIFNNDLCLSNGYSTLFCESVINRFPIACLAIGTHIFPWQLEQYGKIGINKFKLAGRDRYHNNLNNMIERFYAYIKGVEDEEYIKNYALANFTHHLNHNKLLNQILVKDYKRYLPDIKYFKKYGHLCASRCALECRYCYKCAENIEKVFKKKQEEMNKRTIPVCVVTKQTL